MPNFGYQDPEAGRPNPVGPRPSTSQPAGGITPAQIAPSSIPGQAPAAAPGQPAQAQHGGPRLPDFSKGMTEGLPGMGGDAAGGAAAGAGEAAGVGELAELAPLALL